MNMNILEGNSRILIFVMFNKFNWRINCQTAYNNPVIAVETNPVASILKSPIVNLFFEMLRKITDITPIITRIIGTLESQKDILDELWKK